MNSNKEMQEIFKGLGSHESVSLTIGGIPITLRVLDQGSKLALSSAVYEGGNYIPASVRRCLTLKSQFPMATIKTFLQIDEERFLIFLHYLGSSNSMNGQKFQNLLEEFNGLAANWRSKLDEHDRNDLVHVYKK